MSAQTRAIFIIPLVWHTNIYNFFKTSENEHDKTEEPSLNIEDETVIQGWDPQKTVNGVPGVK